MTTDHNSQIAEHEIAESIRDAAVALWDATQEVEAAQKALREAKARLKKADAQLVKACPWSPDEQLFFLKLDFTQLLLFTIKAEADGTGILPECSVQAVPGVSALTKDRLSQMEEAEGQSDA